MYARWIETQIMVSLAGHVVENRFLDTLTTGPSSDLQSATNAAISYVARFAMGPTKLIAPMQPGQFPPAPFVVHHYMIRDEDQFVMKVKRLASWRERSGLRSRLWYRRLRERLGRPVPPFVAGFKATWWNVYREGGESGLRDYYRNSYRIQSGVLPGLLARGDLVRDTAFAEWTKETGRGG